MTRPAPWRCAVLLGLLLLWLHLEGAPPTRQVLIPAPGSERQIAGGVRHLRGTLFLPRAGRSAPAGRRPAVILASGVLTRQARMTGIAEALGSAGLAVLVLENTPWASELDRAEEVRVAVRWVSREPEMEPERVGVLGHSLGANVVYAAALGEPRARAVAALGMALETNLGPPPNLFLGSGLYDQAHAPAEMRRAFAPLLGALPKSGELVERMTYGSIEEGNARRLIISPISAHASELRDPILLGEISRWFSQALGGTVAPGPPSGLWSQWLLRPLRLLIATILFFRLQTAVPAGGRRRMLAASAGIVAALPFLQNPDAPTVAVALLLGGILGSTWAGREELRPLLGRGGLLALTALAAGLGSQLLTHLPELASRRDYLAAVPLFVGGEALQAPFLAAEGIAELLAGWLPLVGVILFLIEMGKPGAVVELARFLLSPLLRPLGQILLPRPSRPGTAPSSTRRGWTVIVLGAVSCAAFLLWRHTLAEYALDAVLLGKLSRFVWQSIVLPGFLLWGFVRLPQIRRRLTPPETQETGTTAAAGSSTGAGG